MAMILRVDEMADALLQLDHPDAGALRDQLVAQANLAGQILQDSLKVKVAPAGWDHAALGGAACAFTPGRKRQKCPEILAQFDSAAEFNAEAA